MSKILVLSRSSFLLLAVLGGQNLNIFEFAIHRVLICFLEASEFMVMPQKSIPQKRSALWISSLHSHVYDLLLWKA